MAKTQTGLTHRRLTQSTVIGRKRCILAWHLSTGPFSNLELASAQMMPWRCEGMRRNVEMHC